MTSAKVLEKKKGLVLMEELWIILNEEFLFFRSCNKVIKNIVGNLGNIIVVVIVR